MRNLKIGYIEIQSTDFMHDFITKFSDFMIQHCH